MTRGRSVKHNANTETVLRLVLEVRKEISALGSYADPQFAPALALMEHETRLTQSLGFFLARAAIDQEESLSDPPTP